MAMTRVDFDRLAEVFAASQPTEEGAELLVGIANEVCLPSNPRFSIEKFVKAAGYEAMVAEDAGWLHREARRVSND